MYIDMTEERNIVFAGVLMALATCVSTISIHYVLGRSKDYIDENRRNVQRNYYAIQDIARHLREQDKKLERTTEILNSLSRNPRQIEPCPMP